MCSSDLLLQDNMKDTVHRMGGKGLAPATLASLEKFLMVGLQPLPARPVVDAAAVAAGRQAFVKAGCDGCHVQGTGSDGQLHDAGIVSDLDVQIAVLRGQPESAGRLFNTPSLRNVGITAPYFHDGSAATLEQAVTRIKTDLRARLAEFNAAGRILEAQRLEQRTMFDIEMMMATGSCAGIENYSRYLTGRKPGEQIGRAHD